MNYLSKDRSIRNALDQFLEVRCFDNEATRSAIRHFLGRTLTLSRRAEQS